MERSTYRIIDANFNRAREAIRVMEDFCRFALNCERLTTRAKQLRHQLCAAINTLDTNQLIINRDTVGDVGIGKTVEEQLSRSCLDNCVAAGCKRLTEALRVLAETTQILNPQTARAIENLRYTAYTLEKDIVAFSSPSEKFKKVRLYVIVSSNLPAEVISLTHKCIAGGADCIQLRTKGLEDVSLFSLAAEFVRICDSAGAISIINDRVDIAVAAGAAGVHLGQNDLPIEQARKLMLAPLIIGKTTHSTNQLRQACEQLPAYVSLGPLFPTRTKPDIEIAGLNYLSRGLEILANTGIGHVAIGGIMPDNVEQVLNIGAKAVAVCSAVANTTDPAAVCRLLREKILSFPKKSSS
jgi:thiamine-phosphate pyrophosphorylase